MKEAEIFARLTPEPTTLLGLKLLPLRLGHLRLLHRIGSAFVVDAEPSYEGLAAAVFICSRSYEDAIEGFADPDLSNQMDIWARKVHGQRWNGKRWVGKAKPIDLGVKWLAFDAYLQRNDLRLREGEDYQVADKENTRSVYAPFVETVRVKLQSRMHFTDSEILNRPWAWCMLDYYLLADSDSLIAIGVQEATREAIADSQAVAARALEKLKENGRLGVLN